MTTQCPRRKRLAIGESRPVLAVTGLPRHRQIMQRREPLPAARTQRRARILAGATTLFNSVEVVAIRPVQGIGVGGWWLKISLLAAPMAVAAAVHNGDIGVVFHALAVVPVIAALTVWLFGIETRGKVLEQLEV